MSTRRNRNRRNRLVVGVCLAISVAVHGVLFGALTFEVPQSSSQAPDGTIEPVVFLEPAIEVVEIRQVREPIVLEPIHVQARPAVATSRPEKLPQPAQGEVSVAKAGEAPPSDAVTGADVHAQGDAFPSTTILAETGTAAQFAMSIRSRMGILEKLPESIRQPVEMRDPHEGHDHGEGDGEEELSWWQRLGMKFGIGDGGKICRPRPELIVDEEKPEKK